MNRRLPALFLSIILFFPLVSRAQWDDADQLPASFHQHRREALRNLLPEKSIAVFFANPVRIRSNDQEFQYHQDPDFYYLTGYLEPNALLLIFKEPRIIDGKETNEIIFVQERNSTKETWTGNRLGVEGTQKLLEFNTVFNGQDFAEFGINFEKFDKILIKKPDAPSNDRLNNADLADLYDQFNSKIIDVFEKADYYQLKQFTAQLREVKFPEEIKLIQKAIDGTISGFMEMMRSIQPGMKEYQAQAIVEYFMKKNGAEYVGYPSIAGAGKNACVLHYSFNRKQLEENDIFLADMGAEYHGYAADITRTLPVNGKFSTEEKTIYSIVLEAQNAGIEACKEGNLFRSTHDAAMGVIAKGLINLGIIKSEDEAKKYFMHGTSHYLGLDVHDVGTKGPLKAGTVITVEPGIYIPKGSPCDSKWWNIGVRIEDDILITSGKPINLSEALPRDIQTIEKIMAEEGENIFK